MTVSFTWHIPEESWARAQPIVQRERRGSQFDRIGRAFFWMLGGFLQIRTAGDCLFPQDRLAAIEQRIRASAVAQREPWYSIPADYGSQGIWVSILDVADQLVPILGTLHTLPDDGMIADRYWQNDGGRTIEFVRRDNVITIRSDLFSDLSLDVTVDEFMAEARRFLLDFIAVLDQRLPELLQWDSLERLRTFYRDERESFSK